MFFCFNRYISQVLACAWTPTRAKSATRVSVCSAGSVGSVDNDSASYLPISLRPNPAAPYSYRALYEDQSLGFCPTRPEKSEPPVSESGGSVPNPYRMAKAWSGQPENHNSSLFKKKIWINVSNKCYIYFKNKNTAAEQRASAKRTGQHGGESA